METYGRQAKLSKCVDCCDWGMPTTLTMPKAVSWECLLHNQPVDRAVSVLLGLIRDQWLGKSRTQPPRYMFCRVSAILRSLTGGADSGIMLHDEHGLGCMLLILHSSHVGNDDSLFSSNGRNVARSTKQGHKKVVDRQGRRQGPSHLCDTGNFPIIVSVKSLLTTWLVSNVRPKYFCF